MTPRQLIRISRFISLIGLVQIAVTTAEAARRQNPEDQRFSIDIAAKPLSDELVDLVYATNISIGGADPKTCRASQIAIRGLYTPEEALSLLLRGSHCTFRRFNESTFSLTPIQRVGLDRRFAGETQQDPTVVVVRRPLRLSQIAMSISVIRPTDLMDNDQDLAGLAARISGMTITNLGPGRDKILLRGMSDSVLTGRTQSTVGLYLDDTPLTYNAPDPDLPMVDMAQVEVLKGPQGALYGQGSLSGVVRLVTNKPDPANFDLSVEMARGDTQGGRPSTNAVGMINLPLVKDQLAIRAVAYKNTAGGFIDDQINGQRVSNTTRRNGHRLGLKWQPADGVSVTLNGMHQTLASANSQYVMGKSRPFKRLLSLAEPHNNHISDLSLTYEQSLDIGTLKVVLNRLRHNILTGYSAQPLAQYIAVPSSGVLYYEEEQTIRLETQEVSLVSPSEGRIRWLIGAFQAASREEFSPNLKDAYTQRVLYNENRWDRLHDLAVFGRIGYNLGPQWSVSAGLRAIYSRHETDSQINHVRLTNYKAMGDVVGLIKTQRLTHSLGIRYQAGPNSMFYLQQADGYRGGGFNTTTLAATAVPSVYLGDHLDSLELGWRQTLSDARLSFNLVGFHINWDDIQSDQLRSTGLPVTVNIGSGANNGLEFEADWQPLEHLSLHTAAQINDPKLNHPNALFANDRDMGMPYIAKQSLSLSVNWRKPLAFGVLENTALLAYRSESPINYGPLRTVRMGGYANLDLATALTAGHMRYKLRLDNATSVRSNSFAYGNPFTVNSSSQITPVRPRTIWLSLAYNY